MKKTISVYFSGTGFPIRSRDFLAGDLYARTEPSESQIKMGFNGCGVDYGFYGTIFGSGLDQQCAGVIERIVQEIHARHQITLNVYGHSRGGIAALLLAKQLSHIRKDQLAINLVLLDPVPGNLTMTAHIDVFQISLANKTMDLQDCQPLNAVLALYPYVPLPAIACHAPLLVSYPPETEVEEEVVSGCHAQAEQLSEPFSKLVKLRVEEFLVQHGTVLQTETDYQDAENMKRTYRADYQEALAQVRRPVSRATHSAQGMVIVATPGAKYLNDRHKALEGGGSQESVSLSIQFEQGLLSRYKRFFIHYPLMSQVIKWTLIALSVTSLLYLTGNLAALPLLAPIVFKLEALSLLACSPLIGASLAALWYGAAKPGFSWCANRFFYPHYAMRHIEGPSVHDHPVETSAARL